MNIKKSFLLIGVVTTLSACASAPQKSEVPTIEGQAILELKKISIEARDELRILAKNKEALHSKSLSKEQNQQKLFQAVYIPEGFEKIVDFSVTDPARKVVEAIAIASGYTLKVFGDEPEVDPWIKIHIVQQPLNEALKEAGMQMGSIATLEVFPSSKLMRLVYKNRGQ